MSSDYPAHFENTFTALEYSHFQESCFHKVECGGGGRENHSLSCSCAQGYQAALTSPVRLVQQEEGSSSQNPLLPAWEATVLLSVFSGSSNSACSFSVVSGASFWHRSGLSGSWELAAPSLTLCKSNRSCSFLFGPIVPCGFQNCSQELNFKFSFPGLPTIL